MGIRYYAYPLDTEMTEQAVADPYCAFSRDPLADAWGLEPGAAVSRMDPERVSARPEMLYLDKAWRHLQILTMPASRGSAARPAYRMVEGDVTMERAWWGWEPWLRAVRPEEMPGIVEDLESIERTGVASLLREKAFLGPDPEQEIGYAGEYFLQALEFATAMRDNGQGLVYMIG